MIETAKVLSKNTMEKCLLICNFVKLKKSILCNIYLLYYLRPFTSIIKNETFIMELSSL